MIGISACLGGIHCRYDGKNQSNQQLIELVENKKAIMICPEVVGGLATPRPPAEIVGGNGFDVWKGQAKVINAKGEDVTSNYQTGALKAYEELKKQKVTTLILKEKSPSCGSDIIYDGTFSGTTVSGVGVATAYFLEQGLNVYSDTDTEAIIRILQEEGVS